MKELFLIIVVIGVLILGFWAVSKIDGFLSTNRKTVQKGKAKEELDRLMRSEDDAADKDKEYLTHVHSLDDPNSVDSGVIDLRENKP